MAKLFRRIGSLTPVFLLPFAALAQVGTGPGCPPGRLCNPLKGVSSIYDLIGKVLDIVVTLGTYVAVIFIIWSGFLFVKAQGNSEKIKEAKWTFFYTLIGAAILIGAKAIQLALTGTIGNLLR